MDREGEWDRDRDGDRDRYINGVGDIDRDEGEEGRGHEPQTLNPKPNL